MRESPLYIFIFYIVLVTDDQQSTVNCEFLLFIFILISISNIILLVFICNIAVPNNQILFYNYLFVKFAEVLKMYNLVF